MKKIAVDMDGVLADVFEQFIKYHAADTGVRKTINDAIGREEHEPFPAAMKHLHTPGFFRTMPVIKNSQAVLEKLNMKHEVFIVSSATQFPQCLSEKQDWLNEHFPFITWQQMVFCGIKTIVQADFMIDDHFKNLDHFAGKTILFNQPHNQTANAGRHTRIYSWDEMEDVIDGEQGDKYMQQLKKTA